MNPQTLQPSIALPATASRGVLHQLAAGALLGVVMLYGVAFAESPLAHNAAHDVRHATGRPCH
jgi:cobalt transporter subunit CbtB